MNNDFQLALSVELAEKWKAFSECFERVQDAVNEAQGRDHPLALRCNQARDTAGRAYCVLIMAARHWTTKQ